MEIYVPYNLEENRELATRLSVFIEGHISAVLKDRQVLIAGGQGVDPDGIPLSTTEIFDPASGKIIPGPSMKKARYGAACAILNDIPYVCGGLPSIKDYYSASCEKFESNNWQLIA